MIDISHEPDWWFCRLDAARLTWAIAIRRLKSSGSLCGYVFWSHDPEQLFIWTDDESNISGYAGLTWGGIASSVIEDQLDATPEHGDVLTYRGVGFDCDHIFDLAPNRPDSPKLPGATYKTFEFVRREVVELLSQLIDLRVSSLRGL